MFYKVIKRTGDIVISSIAIILTIPLQLFLAIGVVLSSTGPIIFKQKRVGENRKRFKIYKFRTMYVNAPNSTPTHKLRKPEKHITGFGKFLRESSLDELPQLYNILKGDMSLVGPRPALPSQRDLLSAREAYGVNALRPGLTGWAQINGRDELPVNVKAAYDFDYLRRMSVGFDICCILGTFTCVLRARGVHEGVLNDK